jgi:hypothetical protein
MRFSTGLGVLLAGAFYMAAAKEAEGQPALELKSSTDSISSPPAPSANPQAPISGLPPAGSTATSVGVVSPVVDPSPVSAQPIVPIQPINPRPAKTASPDKSASRDRRVLRAVRAAVSGVTVARVNGQLILTGTVGTQEEKDAVGAKAAAAAGAETVSNRLVVK